MVPAISNRNQVTQRRTVTWRWWRDDHRGVPKSDIPELERQAFIEAANLIHQNHRCGDLDADIDGRTYVGWWNSEPAERLKI